MTAKASGNELAVLRATGLATVVLVLLTLCNIVTGDDGVEQMGTIVAPVTPCDEKSSEASPRTQLNRTPSAEELLGKANPLFRRITLIGCGLTAILVAMVALNDGRELTHSFLSTKSDVLTVLASARPAGHSALSSCGVHVPHSSLLPVCQPAEALMYRTSFITDSSNASGLL